MDLSKFSESPGLDKQQSMLMDKYQQEAKRQILNQSAGKQKGPQKVNGRLTAHEMAPNNDVNLSNCSDSRTAAQRKTRSYKNREGSSLGRRNNPTAG